MPPRPSSSHSQIPNQGPPQQQQPNQLNSNPGTPNSNNNQQHPLPLEQGPITSPNRPPSSGPPQQMAAQGNYQTPPHMQQHGGYKMGPGSGPPTQMSPYPPAQSQQYSQQGNYSPRPQYTGNYGGPPPPNSMSPGQQIGYPGRPMPNHAPPPGAAMHPQYPPYQQNWAPQPPPGPQPMMTNHIQGKNIGASQQQPQQQPQGAIPPQQQVPGQGPPPSAQGQSGPSRPLNYLKHHLQQKGGYGSQSPTPPPHPQSGYANGPGMHPPMGPPHHMGPPMGPPSSAVGSASSGHPSHLETPQAMGHHSEIPQDNGLALPPGSHPVTSLITTGPDGAPLDDASQQSTLSNASGGEFKSKHFNRKII